MSAGRMRGIFLLFFALAFTSRLALAWYSGAFRVFGLTEMQLIGLSVASTGEFANPFGFESGPTAHSTPPFPLFIAAIFSVLGTGGAAHISFAIASCALSALRCALLPILALDVGLGRVTAIISGVVSLIYVGALETEIKGGLDGPWVALTLMALVWSCLRLWQSGSWRTRTPWGFFALCGWSVLLNPSLLPPLAAFLMLGFVAAAPEARKRFGQQVLLLAATVALFLLPWGLRNYAQLDEAILLRSNLGLEFWLSNGPDRTFDLGPNYGAWHPLVNRSESLKVVTQGEVDYNRQKMTEAIEWVSAHPGDFLRLTARRFVAWWFPPGAIVVQAGKALLTLVAVWGLVLLFRVNRTLAWLLTATWIAFPALFYVIQWSSRYRYPMDWQLSLCAAVALGSLLRLRDQASATQTTSSPPTGLG